MPTHARAQVSWAVGSPEPRDRFVITPCFRHQAITPLDEADWNALATDLRNAITTWAGAAAVPRLRVAMYDIEGTKPVYPMGYSEAVQTAAPATPNIPGELALCLSFYGTMNRPRHRGRLYIPAYLTPANAGVTARPSATVRQKVADLVPLFAGLGSVDVDWIVWSGVDGAARKVQNWWVDDEWDIQRRRGGRPTMRLAGTTGG